jgi:hypothetical protein
MCCKLYLLILLLSQIDEDLARRVLNIQQRENGGTIVRHGNILQNVRNCKVLRGLSIAYPYVVDHHLVQTGGTEGALDDIGNSLCSQNFKKSATKPKQSPNQQ